MKTIPEHRAKPRGFSLIEMLVVLAISAILLGLVITPLVTTFNFTNRARRSVQVEDAARYAMELTSREVADAMELAVASGDYEPFTYYPSGTPGQGTGVVVRSQGYITAWDNAGVSYQLPNAMIDVLLPHDELGLEGGGIQQPMIPQHITAPDGTQHPILVRYFVGLTHPNRVNASGNPIWRNNAMLPTRGQQNMYTLYRVEFDPYDPRFKNWAIPSNGEKSPDGRDVYLVNPNFFYDNTQVNGKSVAQWWREKAVAIMPTDGMDLVDFVRQDPKNNNSQIISARSLVTFNPLVVASDTATPADADIQPNTYRTQYGHWCGIQNDGTVPLVGYGYPESGFPGGNIGNFLPRIVVWDQDSKDENGNPYPDGGIRIESEMDSSSPGPGKPMPGWRRDLTWNSKQGMVIFSLPAKVYENSSGGENGIPSLYTPLKSAPDYQALVSSNKDKRYITPRSEVVTVYERSPSGDVRPVVYSRIATDMKDVYEVPDEIALQNGAPQQLPPPRQYIVIDDRTILIGYPYPTLDNPVQSQPVPSNVRVTVKYLYQTNNPKDLVRVDYLTREVININMTARLYDPVNNRPITTTVANRIRVRNMQR